MHRSIYRLWDRVRRQPRSLLVLALMSYGAVLVYFGLVRAPGPHDCDWPLLMWLAKYATWQDPAPLVVGHYGVLQLVLVRLFLPIVGSTLIAAKLINIVSTLAAAGAVYAITESVTQRVRWAWIGTAAFLLTCEAFLTAQSEFGDPLALGFFAWGLYWLLRDRKVRGYFYAGLLIGIAGIVRLHFQTFGWAAWVAIAGYEYSKPREDGESRPGRLLALAAGILVGQAPVFVLNLVVHGQLFSPIAHAFVGEALFGANAYDMPNTYALHPPRELLANHKLALVNLFSTRLTEVPGVWLMAGIVGLLGLMRRDAGQPRRCLLWLLAAGYYVGFAMPSWVINARLLLPFELLLSICAATGAAAWASHWSPRRHLALVLVAALLVVGSFCSDLRWLGDRLRSIDQRWQRNVEITAVLRRHGLVSARDAFAVDWDCFPTDDPNFVGYYSFGFWNLLVPAYATERPNPFSTLSDPQRFTAFLRERGVLFLLLPRRSPFPSLEGFVAGTQTPEGYVRLADLKDDVVFKRQP